MYRYIAVQSVGRLPVLLVKMNPDLAMGEALLKNTGAGITTATKS